MTPPSVLIVGGGPTGLVLGLTLAKCGVGMRIIDKVPKFQPGTRGPTSMPRSLEVHHFLGTCQDLLAAGRSNLIPRMYPIGAGSEGYITPNIMPPSPPTDAIPISRPVMIGQDTQTSILRSHLAKHGVNVELSTELRSFQQHPDHVAVTMSKILDGEEHSEDAQFKYIVGTDGAHSVVRKGLGLTFLGETRDGENMVVGDIFVEEGFIDPSAFHIYGEAATEMLVLRATEHEKKYSFSCAGPHLDYATLASDREELLKAFVRITGRNDIKWGEIGWISNYRPNIRMVDRFGSGRAFVAGDAAHIHSPAGGQGMNSGCLDAFNLGWKLALVVKGLAKESLLESYNEERLPVIAAMLQITSKIHRTMFTQGNQQKGWNRGGNLDQLGVNYRGSPIVVDERSPAEVAHNAYEAEAGSLLSAGDRAPDASGLEDMAGNAGVTRLFGIFAPTHHTVLVFTKDLEDASHILAAAAKAAKGLPLCTAVVFPSGTANTLHNNVAATHVLVDQKGSAIRNYAIVTAAGTTAVVVRPDGVVGAIVSSVDGMQRYFENITL
ncbi:hypothetical protein HGRIS_005116 [Hohenbuehelia grisea]|uniref:FAD-binding domain-containing protein n=1 Tax=Hohenbuehelia grisea TaxID=104357 RepID=A0ABR3JEQ7_9AGAR